MMRSLLVCLLVLLPLAPGWASDSVDLLVRGRAGALETMRVVVERSPDAVRVDVLDDAAGRLVEWMQRSDRSLGLRRVGVLAEETTCGVTVGVARGQHWQLSVQGDCAEGLATQLRSEPLVVVADTLTADLSSGSTARVLTLAGAHRRLPSVHLLRFGGATFLLGGVVFADAFLRPCSDWLCLGNLSEAALGTVIGGIGFLSMTVAPFVDEQAMSVVGIKPNPTLAATAVLADLAAVCVFAAAPPRFIPVGGLLLLAGLGLSATHIQQNNARYRRAVEEARRGRSLTILPTWDGKRGGMHVVGRF